MNIQRYYGVKDNTGNELPVEIVFSLIRLPDPDDELFIKKIRSDIPKEEKDEIKKSLTAVTWSGTFKKRKANELIEYSGLICIDIDKLEPLAHALLKDKLKTDPYTYFLFTSPSGTGLKIIIRVKGGPEMYLQNFLAIEKYFKTKYDIQVDKSGKDICRLCFLSNDPESYHNKDSIPFLRTVEKSRNKKITLRKETESLNDIAEFTNLKMKFEEGNRNNWIHLFANNANRKGFSETDTLSYILSNYNPDNIRESEIKSTIHSAFKNTNEHGKFKKKDSASDIHNKSNVVLRQLSGAMPNNLDPTQEITEEKFKEKYQFFDIKWKSDVDKDGNTTRKVGGIQINYLKFLAILTDLGFRRIDIDKGHYFIHIENNIIKEVDEVYIKGSFKLHLESMPEVMHIESALLHRNMILNYMLGRQANFFDPKNILCHLPVINTEQINEDTEKEAFFYYANKCVKVTAENIELLDYSTLSDKYVWADSILTREINLLDFDADQENNIWAKFLFEVCDQDNERLIILMQIIGYLMHKYYEGKLKAIVFTDSRISDDPQGRTGKGLILKGIRQIMNRDNHTDKGVVCTINGKEFNPDNERRFEKCDINTKLIHINDVKANYDVERHYNEIEDGITVNKKFQNPFTIWVKIVLSTNRTLKINGDSSLDRFRIFDLSAHYSKDWTPEKEFGKWFFRDFTEHEWNLFDSFMLFCMQNYLKDGVKEYKSINLEKRILHEQIGEELINFLEDFPNAEIEESWNDFGIVPGRDYNKKALYDAFIRITGSDSKRYSQRRFTSKLRHYKHLSEKWKSDSQDKEGNYYQEKRSNGKDFIWFELNENKNGH